MEGWSTRKLLWAHRRLTFTMAFGPDSHRQPRMFPALAPPPTRGDGALRVVDARSTYLTCCPGGRWNAKIALDNRALLVYNQYAQQDVDYAQQDSSWSMTLAGRAGTFSAEAPHGCPHKLCR